MAQYPTREVHNEEQLEVMLPIGRKVIMNKKITLILLIDNVIFTQQCCVLPITNLIILDSDFLDINFSVLDIDNQLLPCIALITRLLPASPIILNLTSA